MDTRHLHMRMPLLIADADDAFAHFHDAILPPLLHRRLRRFTIERCCQVAEAAFALFIRYVMFTLY